MKPFILEFIGGCWDGMNLCSESSDPVEVKLAKGCYAETEGGTEGKTTVLPSEYGTRRGTSRGSKYVVVHRMEVGGELLIRLELCCEDREVGGPCHCKRVLLDFQGGHLHGLQLDSHSDDLHEALLAASFFCLTEQGKPGATLGCGSHLLPRGVRREKAPPRPAGHYMVTCREEGEDEVIVRFQCRTASP